MGQRKDIVGAIDFGSRVIRVLIGRRDEDGTLLALALRSRMVHVKATGAVAAAQEAGPPPALSGRLPVRLHAWECTGRG